MSVYFIQDDALHHIKIGSSNNPDGRERMLQTGCPQRLTTLLVIDGDRSLESHLHSVFAEYRIAGEWFAPGSRLLQYILSKKAPEIKPKAAGWPLKIYLAGKISKNCWRSSIVNHLRTATWDDHSECSIFGIHSYVGPFFQSCDHGCSHGEDTHGCDAESQCQDDEQTMSSNEVVGKCLSAISEADLVFAWIDSHDCYGTITELGYAKALGKSIFITSPRRFRDMWFVNQLAVNYPSVLHTEPKQALLSFLEYLAPKNPR